MSAVVMRAKFIVTAVEEHNDEVKGDKYAETLRMSAVSKDAGYEGEGLDEDNTFAKFSPSGSFEVNVANENLFGKFAVGEKYYMDFTKADD